MEWSKFIPKFIQWRKLGYTPRLGLVAAALTAGTYVGYQALLQRQDNLPLAKRWERRVPITLLDRRKVSSDVELFRFALPNSYDMTGHDIVSSVKLISPFGTTRYYTPINPPDERGVIDFFIKRKHHGRMCLDLENVQRGSIMFLGGWFKEFRYTPNQFDKVGWIASGSGISPLLSILRTSLLDPEDKTKFSLLYFNATKENTPYYHNLIELQQDYPERFNVTFGYTTQSRDTAGEGEVVGLLNEDMLKQTMPTPSENCKIFVCGTEQLTRSAAGKPISWVKANNSTGTYSQGFLGGLLKDMGYSRSQVYKFGYTVYVG